MRFRFCGGAAPTAEAILKVWKSAVSFELVDKKGVDNVSISNLDEEARNIILQNINKAKYMRGKGSEFVYSAKDAIIYSKLRFTRLFT